MTGRVGCRPGSAWRCLSVSGVPGLPPTATNNLAETACQDPCASRMQQPEREAVSGRSCRFQSIWWNDVGDALSGVATAVRLPRP